MKKKYLMLMLGLASLLPPSANAASFEPLGVRALGMGGTNVASVRDGNASYWNPAAYGFFGNDDEYSRAVDNNRLADKDFGLSVDAGVGVAVHGGLADLVDTIGAIDFNAISNASQNNSYNAQTIADSLNLISQLDGLNSPKSGVEVRANGEVDIRIGHFGIGARNLTGVSVTSNADIVNIAPTAAAGGNAQAVVNAWAPQAPAPGYTPQYFTPAQINSMTTSLTNAGIAGPQATNTVLAVDNAMAANSSYQGQQAQFVQTFNTMVGAATGGPIDQNTSTLKFRGVGLFEIPLTYGYAFSPNLSMGGSLKYIQARIYAHDMRVFGQNSNNFKSDATKTYTTDSNFSADLGVMYRASSFQLGLVARNLTSPKFTGNVVDNYGTVIGSYTYKLKPSLKFGAAFMPWDTVSLEVAADLTKNDTVMNGYSSQFINAGFEWDIFKFLALRLGAYKNIAESDIGLVYTAGLGLNLWAARIDIAAAYGSKKVQYKGNSYPTELRGAVAVNIDF